MKKLLALALSCAALALVVMPGAAAEGAESTVTVTGGHATFSAVGAYADGFAFAASIAGTDSITATNSAAGALSASTDYLKVYSDQGANSSWTLQMSSSDYTSPNTGKVYAVSAGVTSDAIVIASLDTAVVSHSLVGTGCALTNDLSIVGTADTAVMTPEIVLATGTTTELGACTSYEVRYTPTYELAPPTGGFSADTYTATWTYAFSDNS